MAYSEVTAGMANATLRAQVRVAILKVAQYVLTGGSPNNRNHAFHAENANKDPDSYVGQFMYNVATDSAVISDGYSTATDLHVQAVVDAIYPRLWM